MVWVLVRVEIGFGHRVGATGLVAEPHMRHSPPSRLIFRHVVHAFHVEAARARKIAELIATLNLAALAELSLGAFAKLVKNMEISLHLQLPNHAGFLQEVVVDPPAARSPGVIEI